jgi:hypothetical protein
MRIEIEKSIGHFLALFSNWDSRCGISRIRIACGATQDTERNTETKRSADVMEKAAMHRAKRSASGKQ